MEAPRRRFFNCRPMLPGMVGALAGAIVAVKLGNPSLWLLGLWGVALGAFALVRRWEWFALPLFFGLLLLRGALTPTVEVPAGTYPISGTVINRPARRQLSTTAVLYPVYISGTRVPGALQLSVPAAARPAYGETLFCTVTLEEDPTVHCQGPFVVMYAGRARGGISTNPSRGEGFYGWSLAARERLEGVAGALFYPWDGPAKGILLGDKSDVDFLTYEAYRRSGLLHLLTVSGLHVGVAGAVILALIRGRRRWLRMALAWTLVALFCLLTGLAPSALRAAVMLLCFHLGLQLRRQDDGLSQLGCALILLLLLEPRYLLCNGFCLSFGCIYGLVCLSRPLSRLLPGGGQRRGSLLAGAFSVFFATAPLLSRVGGDLSWVGIPLSLLAIPLAPFLLVPGWAAMLLYPLLPQAARAVALVPRGVLLLLQSVATLAPWEGLSVPYCGDLPLILWYAGILLVSDLFLPNARRPAYLGWSVLFVALVLWMTALV